MNFNEHLLERKRVKLDSALNTLHVNDENTHPAEYTKLWNVGPKKAEKIFHELIFHGKFDSEENLIPRV